jgi:hypothetical protein
MGRIGSRILTFNFIASNKSLDTVTDQNDIHDRTTKKSESPYDWDLLRAFVQIHYTAHDVLLSVKTF